MVNIYMDSKYTCNIIHSNIQIWKEQGFLTTMGSPITNAKYNMALLQVATLPHKAATLHCKGHQKYNTFISISHNLADITTKQVAQQMLPQAILPIH
jgi:ribonuclease HI